MADGTIYSRPFNPRGRIALAAAAWSGVALTEKHCDPSKNEFPDGYAGKFPVGKIPAYENGSVHMHEIMAIAQYIVRKSGDPAHLYGHSEEDAARVTMWFSFANTELLPAIGGWFRPLTGADPYNKAAVTKAEEQVGKLAAILDKELASRTFLVGERITLADIAVATMIGRGAEMVLDTAWRAKFPHVNRHFLTVINQPQYKKVVPEPKLVDQRIVFTPPKKDEKPKKEAAAPKEAAPKADKKKKKDEDEDEDYDPTPAEPKAKHPCEALGAPGSFPLDEWKRTYSNKETKEALAWLDGKYDPKDYTMWKAVYKYPEDLTQVFMSSNLIGGFHNRLEASRKYLFGSAGVYGTSNNSKIQGAYMIRGSDVKAIFEVAPDHESYEFTQLDYAKPEDREFIAGCWEWTNTMDGLEYADGKVFK